MSAPSLLTVYPADNDIGIPIGEEIVLSFDKGVDLTSAQSFVVLYGPDSDQTSGPDSALWIDADTGDNPFFLRSPGFKGLVDTQVRAVYYDLATGLDISTPTIVSEAAEALYGGSGIGHRLYVRPSVGQFAADVEYVLHILGDPSNLGTGISSRTVFDTEPDVGNTSTTGVVVFSGGYTGTSADIITLEITTGGDIGTAKYKWWFNSEGVGSAVYDKLSNRQYRRLGKDVKVRFTGEGFVAGDIFTVNVEPPQYLAINTKVTFTTNDGTYTLAPDSPPTPATSQAPDTVIPDVPGASTAGSYLQVLEMSPPDGSYNIDLKTRTITILFDEVLDASTITDDSVRLFKTPALGYFESQPEPVELQKKLTANGQLLTIEF